MIFDDKYLQIERTADTLDIKALGPNTFGLMKQSRKAAKVAYQGTRPLEKFGRFAETVEPQEAPAMDESTTDANDDNDNDPTEKELDDFINEYAPTPKQSEATTEETQQTALKPPQSVSVAINEYASSDQPELVLDLQPRNSKRRDPMPGVLITDPIQETTMITEPISEARNIQSSISEPIPMIQDDQAPTDEESQPAKETTSSAPNTHAGEGRVFELEKESATKDLIIGKLDVRVSELEKDNTKKNSKISYVQENLGGLTALYYDLKQRLAQKFSDDFKSFGDKGTAPSSGRKKHFTDKYGDRSGILMWGYEADRNIWVTKRKSGNVEYYNKKVDFMSWTKVDLSKLIQASFHNPSNDPTAVGM
ncbi:hypothetical protein LXL04_028880 [Taraxacum kok-saghyz]